MTRAALYSSLILVLYFSLGTFVLVNKMPIFLFPKVELKNEQTSELQRFSFYDSSNNELLIREYGQSLTQCVIFFPGQHAGVNHYEKSIFSDFIRHNFKVFSISYPGQDGAIGQVDSISSLTSLIKKAVHAISLKCPLNTTVVYGRSLGASIAMFSVSDVNISGFILEGVSPSLSLAVSNHLSSKWYLSPLTLLPISMLLPNDYMLAEPFDKLIGTPIVIFQGDMDSKTPLIQLKKSWNYRNNVTLQIVTNGEHSDSYIKANNDIIITAKGFL